MPLLSNKQQLDAVCSELQEMSLRRQQLNDRLSLLSMLKGFRQNAGYRDEAQGSNEKDECEQIAEELKKLSEKKRELQAKKDALEGSCLNFTGGTFSTMTLDGPAIDDNQIFYVEKPPDFPAPQVILEVQKLPPKPSPTQCPYCQQYVTTETSTVTGNTAWLVCLVCTFICCIAGCCLLPFCTDNFKDVVHKCPKCRGHIHTCKKL